MTAPGSGLVERLRAKRRFRLREHGPVHEAPVNPDGPEAADRIETLEAALETAVKKLRKCMEVAGNADFAIDACCEQFETALAKVRP